MSEPRILIVDDEAGMVRTMERVLGASYEVAGATSSQEARELAKEFGPDLAILDIRMPGMDGFALMAELRKIRADVDVIFMTGVIHELDAQLIRAVREKAFYFIQKPFDREVLLTLVERCLELRRLGAENARHTARLESQLHEARSFQKELLPAPRGSVGGVEIAVRYRVCASLGGDIHDYARAGKERAAVLVADVSGHGVSAAMLTALVKSAFQQGAADAWEPLATAHRVANAIRTFEANRFVTLFCARLDRREGSLVYVNAGHPPGLLSRGDGWQRLEPTGPLISPALPGARWQQVRETLAPGGSLLLHTDGVTESEGEGGFFGLDRLVRASAEGGGQGETILNGILAALDRFSGGRPAEDDQTLMTVWWS